MSGIPPNRCKKNGKKGKTLGSPEVVQVKSVKLNTKNLYRNRKSLAKSEENLRNCRKLSDCEPNGNVTETESQGETSILKKIGTLSLNHDDNHTASTSQIGVSGGGQETIEEREIGAPMDCGDDCYEASSMGDEYAYASKYYPKSSKSIRFINQVAVLYFNGEDVVYESMEPLKKEIEQQERNKEMRKEHLMTKGHEVDNVYLF